MIPFSQLQLYFILYSVVGWTCETIFCSVLERKFVNRGFLRGPYCPIYGAGALLILSVTRPFLASPPLVFLVSMAAATVLEYFTSWLMEAVFQIRWWDYSHERFNLNGRISLRFSVLFGVMGCGAAYLLHPAMRWLTDLLPHSVQRVLSNAAAVLFLLDLLTTVGGLLGFTQRLQRLQAELRELWELSGQRDWFDARDWDGSLARLRELCLEEEKNPVSMKLLSLLDSIEELRGQGSRLLGAFPGMRMHARELNEALDSLRRRVKKSRVVAGSRVRGILAWLRARSEKARREAADAFGARLGYYHLFWVFVVAGIIGYLVETAYCLLTTGTIESRQGLLYGPFNQVYGFGAVLMVLLLTPLRKRNDRWLFAGGALVGGTFECVCSLIQEHVFGSVSWRYEEGPFPIADGRTSLVFMFFWGILGVWFIKGIHPWMTRVIDKIPRRQGTLLVSVLTVVLTVNLFLSGTAVRRWSERSLGVPATNGYERFLDTRYPDEFMEDVYPNMTMLSSRDREQ